MDRFPYQSARDIMDKYDISDEEAGEFLCVKCNEWTDKKEAVKGVCKKCKGGRNGTGSSDSRSK